MRAVNKEDHRVNCPDGMDNSNLEDGVGDMGFDPNDYEGVKELSHCPLPLLPCSHHMLRQPILCTIMKTHTAGAVMLHLL